MSLRPPLALTMGEPAGIAAEITLKAWEELRAGGPAFFYIGSAELLRDTARRLARDVRVDVIADPGQAGSDFANALPVLDVGLKGDVVEGNPSPGTAAGVIASIEKAVALTRDGVAAAVVTNPIQKSALQRAGFAHPGHTEFLQELSGPGYRSTMMLVGGDLHVVPVTIHQSLKSAIGALRTDLIVTTTLAAAAGLRRDFGIGSPRMAIAGLNPHAGEDGSMGDEEGRIIAPAIATLRSKGLDVAGPLSPDTMFSARARKTYDAAICMYHDQALIPLKTLDMDGGVNVTLGLPFVRTSPDHGTALDIVGKGIADPGSLIAALRLGDEMASRREGKIAA